MEMSKIEEAIEDVINGHLSGMVFSDLIINEVRDTWDMDELNRVDETVDRVDALEAWIHDAEDKFSIQNVIDLENSIKNLVEHTNQLQMRIRDLEDRLNDYEEIREMAWQSANKSFFQKLMFWRS
jgi:regulator of replication initiation timing